jgi:lipoprotein-releasing system permease protein
VSSNLQIAYRFLTAKKGAMVMSLSCIVLGIGLFVVTQATTHGFKDLFIKTLLGSDGAIRVQDEIQDTIQSIEAGGGGSGSNQQVAEKAGRKYVEGIPQPKALMESLENFHDVTAIAEVLHGDVTVRSSFKDDTAQIYGIDLNEFLKVSNLGSQIVQGDLDGFEDVPQNVLVGSVLATRLQLNQGDTFLIQVPPSVDVPDSARWRRYKVAAIFETGVEDIDRSRIFLQLSEARSLLQKRIEASYLQVSLGHPDRAAEEAAQMEVALHHTARPWQERQLVWLSVFNALSVSSAITVMVFILIAGLAMFNTLAMMVMEKTKEIAILRSMGYERRDISLIFVWQAIIVLLIGAVLGSLFGAVATYGISRVALPIRGLFKSDTFPVSWSLWYYGQATLIAIAMVMVASLIPARRAARLEPGDIIRGTAQ